MPTTPVAVGSGRMSGPPTGFATQSGSLTTPDTLKRIARGVLIAFGKPIATRRAGSVYSAITYAATSSSRYS
jgi:hypothetical protein